MRQYVLEILLIALTILAVAAPRLPVLRTLAASAVGLYGYLVLLLGPVSGWRGMGSRELGADGSYGDGWADAATGAVEYFERRSIALATVITCLVILLAFSRRRAKPGADRRT